MRHNSSRAEDGGLVPVPRRDQPGTQTAWMLALFFALWVSGALCADESAETSFARDILPIFEQRCVACHGDQEKGGFRLHSAELFSRGGDHGAVVTPGNSADSRLIQYVTGQNDAGIVMPPRGERLTRREIEALRSWIDGGAHWPDGLTIAIQDEPTDHWAFRLVTRPALPRVSDPDWSANGVDAFVLAHLERDNIRPSSEADRPTLIRRLSFDLRGLPPTPVEVADFIHDAATDAYDRLVERFLSSPQFGERWARHWLDVARYADSEGNEGDHRRPIWTYRDWVVRAMNADMPFDQFTIEQIAGDLLPGATLEHRVATGFHRASVGGGNTHPSVVIDRVNATGTAFLGLTLGCAQCHSHKFDPISQREYYQLYAFFNNMVVDAKVELASAEEIDERDAIAARVSGMKEELTKYEEKLDGGFSTWEAELTPEKMDSLRPEMKALLSVAVNARTEKQARSLLDWFKEIDPGFVERKEAIEALAATEPDFDEALVLKERDVSMHRRETFVFVRGVFENKGEKVLPGVPRVLPALTPEKPEQPNRLDFARWLVSADNPLTPRVTVNRIWQRYFGVGLVDTPDNFGLQGHRPSHPELLDWLANEFVTSGWSMKHLHRLIVTSSTYRQSSVARPDLKERDPLNRLLARQARLRLEAETIRDGALLSSGLLSLRMGGPGIHPYQVDGVMDGRADKSRWKMGSGEDLYRRGLYVHFWRLTPHPFLKAFDAPDSTESCARRIRSNTPVQALTALNDPWFVECALDLAEYLLRESGVTDAERLRRAFQRCVARVPSERELALLTDLLDAARRSFSGEPERAAKLCRSIAWAHRDLDGASSVELAAWAEVSRALLNLDEFINRE